MDLESYRIINAQYPVSLSMMLVLAISSQRLGHLAVLIWCGQVVCISQITTGLLVDRNEVQKVESTFPHSTIFTSASTFHYCYIIPVHRYLNNMSIPRIIRTALRTSPSVSLRASTIRLPTRVISKPPIYQSFRKPILSNIGRKANEKDTHHQHQPHHPQQTQHQIKQMI